MGRYLRNKTGKTTVSINFNLEYRGSRLNMQIICGRARGVKTISPHLFG
jgi:hypothetical protein